MTQSNGAQNAAYGTSIFTLLTVTFVVLKLMGVIDWSWWAVTSPTWGSMLATGTIITLIGGFVAVKEIEHPLPMTIAGLLIGAPIIMLVFAIAGAMTWGTLALWTAIWLALIWILVGLAALVLK